MKKIFFLICVIIIQFAYTSGQTQTRVHSHNDYLQKLPFWYAYSNGLESIEVDIILKDKKLYVAHDIGDISDSNTLQSVYLDPLEELISKNSLREIQLLVDIKSDGQKTLKELIRILEADYPNIISTELVKIVISGNKPDHTDYIKYPKFILFDHQNIDNLSETELDKVGLVSLDFKKISIWNGYGRMIQKDYSKLSDIISIVKSYHKPIRFWNTPDIKNAWLRLSNMGIDYINTDKPNEVKAFLKNVEKNTFSIDSVRNTYLPKYSFNKNKKPKNIILLIGDGNGLAQISASLFANKGELSLTKIKNIGLVKTNSSDDLITDSAAGGTAMATGTKTKNRHIGVDSLGIPLTNLTERLSSGGFSNALITTDAIYGATPATFYAHREERDDTNNILLDLHKSEIDFFIACGGNNINEISQNYKICNMTDSIFPKTKFAILLDETNNAVDKDSDILEKSTKTGLKLLKRNNNPFFLLIEAAKIDSGGHNNDIETIVDKSLSFNGAISEVLKFADRDKETLVIITADHETSGLGILGGNIKSGQVIVDFLSVDHTGILVPLFAYGPGSEDFSGVYENTEIFDKILDAIGMK